jgi:hypothetical protein
MYNRCTLHTAQHVMAKKHAFISFQGVTMHGIFFMISCSKILRMSKNYFEFRICIFIFSMALVVTQV